MKKAAPPPRKNANSLMFASDYVIDLVSGLRDGRTVTRYVLEPHQAAGDGPAIEFEIVVTKVGTARVPRVLTEQAKR